MPSAQGSVGIQNNLDGPNPITIRLGKQGDTMSSELHSRYYEQTYRGNMFNVASQAGVVTSVGVNATYTGLVLANPITSNVNLVLNKCAAGQTVIETVVNAFGLAFGYNKTTNVTLSVSATPQSNLIGSGLSAKAVAATGATLPTAPLFGPVWGTNPTATTDASALIDLEGSIILIPGAYACWVTATAASPAAACWFSFSWEEVPL